MSEDKKANEGKDTGNLDPRQMEELYSAFDNADYIVRKRYRAGLDQYPVYNIPAWITDVLPSDGKSKNGYGIGDNVQFFRIDKLVYDREENIADKLTTVYHTMSSFERTSVVMLLKSDGMDTELYLGVAERFDENEINVTSRGNKLSTLKTAFEANFPGSEVSDYDSEGYPIDRKKLIQDACADTAAVSCVTGVASLRNKQMNKNEQFIQGLEKLIDSMRGKRFSAFFIADCKTLAEIENLCANYEDIYSQLSPFAQSQQTIGRSDAISDTKSVIDGITDTTNESVTDTVSHSHTQGKCSSDSIGVGVGGGVEIKKVISLHANVNYNHIWGKNESDTTGDSESKTRGTSKSLTSQNSVAKGISNTSSNGLQITFKNRSVQTLMERIDEQIKRLRECESFGTFDFGCYFIAEESSISAAAASIYDSLMRGEDSACEISSVNTWTKEPAQMILSYLKRFYHPLIAIPKLAAFGGREEIQGKNLLSVTPSTLVSGREMALQMGLPKKSVPGVPVVECTEFGREIVSLSESGGNIPLGKIYHMHREEDTAVKIDAKSLTAHTFVTGSTGSGKSTTIYKLLDELSGTRIGDTDETVKFMVIEPAKGEYKNALAMNKKLDVHVYGTNPNVTKLLRINPFKFPKDQIHIYEHLDRLTEIFNVCWPMYAAMPAVLKAAMENAYRSAGWNLVRSENKHGDIYPSFVDVALEVEKYINKSEYSDENKSNYKGSLLTRLESLTNGINSMIFTADDMEDQELFDENVIVDLSRVGSSETKALIMGILILKLQEYRTACARGSNAELRHVTVLEEAHNLLKRTSTEQSSETANLLGKSVEMLANAIAEMRTYGEGFVIADQSPGLLDMSVIRNTNTKIIMRLPDFSDRELVGKAAGLNDDQIIELSKLPRGVAAVYQNDWIEPVLCSIQKPNLVEGSFVEKSVYPQIPDESLLFDLLDSKFRAKLDDLTEEDAFRKAILKSSVPTEVKVRLLDYLSAKKSAEGIKILASTVFDYFKNARETLEHSYDEVSAEALRTAILAELEPSIMEYADEQVDLLITLIIKEYTERYFVDYPVWREFALRMGRRELF